MPDLGNFDANAVEPSSDSFGALPPDRYKAMLTDSVWVDNASGTGKHLKLTFTVIEGKYEGAKLWHRLNLDNPSEKAVQIAKGQLSTICRAVGVLTPRDSTELHNLPLVLRVDVREYEGAQYNDVKGFYSVSTERASYNDTKPATTTTTTKTTTQAPWVKKL